MHPATRQCADELLELVPLMMRIIRAKVRSRHSPELSLPQFRALAFLGRNPNATLGDVAAFLALTPPAASKLVEGLVAAGLATRSADPMDRRRIALSLTGAGQQKYGGALKVTADFLAERVGQLSAAQRNNLLGALQSLHAIFSDAPPETAPPAGRPKRPVHAA